MSEPSLVARQYSQWIYPQPLSDLAPHVASGNYQIGDPSLEHSLFWPDRPYRPGMKILVAGCGTVQAAHYAFTNPQAEVVGIDLSEPSLCHQLYLKEKHGLSNLRVRQLDLCEAGRLGEEFDFIACTGVLHHLPDPPRGFAALRSVLKPDGAMNVMVYGAYPRAGIYMLQDAFRHMGLGQAAEDVATVRQVLGAVPPWHFIRTYMEHADDLSYDSGVVDTFLHPQDRAYTVAEVLDAARSAGLAHQAWIDNLDYYPDGGFPAGHPLLERLAALPDHRQWSVMEALALSQACHRYALCRDDRDPATYLIDFASDSLLDRVPEHRHLLRVAPGPDGVRLQRSWHECALTGWDADAFALVDGRRTIGAILSELPGKRGRKAEQGRSLFHRLWRLGHVLLRFRW